MSTLNHFFYLRKIIIPVLSLHLDVASFGISGMGGKEQRKDTKEELLKKIRIMQIKTHSINRASGLESDYRLKRMKNCCVFELQSSNQYLPLIFFFKREVE